MSWSSPRCNVGAGPHPAWCDVCRACPVDTNHPSTPGEDVLWALAFPGSTSNAKGEGTCVA